MSDVSFQAQPDPASEGVRTRGGVVQPPQRYGEWFDETLASDEDPMLPVGAPPDPDDHALEMSDVLPEDLDLGGSQPLLFPELGEDIPMADERSSEGELERTVVPNPDMVDPPRVESATEGGVDSAVGQDSEASSTVRRRVGRPRKHPPKARASGSQAPTSGGKSTSQHSATADESSQAESSRPKRGRPRKNPPAPVVTESASNAPRRIPCQIE